MNTPRELTAEEQADLEACQREWYEEWLREQAFNAVVDAMDPAWSINDYENSIAEQSLDDDE